MDKHVDKATSEAVQPAVSRYRAPALEKGLDILELLARYDSAVNQAMIARELNRSPGEIYRMLDCLEQRGYVQRDRPGDLYRLTAKMFELSHQHPPTRRLLDLALPIMRRFAHDTNESCHLGIKHHHGILVVANVDSPDFIGFSVRLGRMLPLFDSVSGLLLLAYQPVEDRERWIREWQTAHPNAPVPDDLDEIINTIRHQHYWQGPSSEVEGIIGITAPVLDPSGSATAVLATPVIVLKTQRTPVENVREMLVAAAATISNHLGAPINTE
ncbi:MAG: IclR family transcriptional regulator [Phycisphaerales bacterium]|jgi:DNA-binding IclR family transcriptional regulator|nr:IclR family transcriptional regulator [Phycisphaerales bacterium]